MSDTPRDLTHFASELRSLTPHAGQLDRDQLMFRAGQASVPQPSRIWPISAGALAVACLTLAAVVTFRPEPLAVERVVYVQVPSAPAVVASRDDRGALDNSTAATNVDNSTEKAPYLRFRDQVIRWGPDAMPRGAATESPHTEKLRYQLDMPPNTLERGTLIGGQSF